MAVAAPGSDSPRRRKGASKKIEARLSFNRIGTVEEGAVRMTDADRRQLETEKALVDIYDKLGTVEGYLTDAQSEIYLTTFRDRWCAHGGVQSVCIDTLSLARAPSMCDERSSEESACTTTERAPLDLLARLAGGFLQAAESSRPGCLLMSGHKVARLKLDGTCAVAVDERMQGAQ